MPRVRGPKDGEVLKASFNGREKRTFSDLKQTNILVLLSIVGNDYCSNEYLNAITQEACLTHKKATFLIADEVYWNNLKNTEIVSTSDMNSLMSKATELGDDFIDGNMDCFLKILGIKKDDFNSQYGDLSINQKIEVINGISNDNGFNFEIVRWHDWVNNPKCNYSEIQLDLQGYYNTEPQLILSIENTSNDFARRHKQDGDENLWRMRSRSYLKDESPAVIWLAAKLGYEFICYPGDIIEPFVATKNFFIHEQPSEKLPAHIEILSSESRVNWLDIYFTRSHFKKPLSTDLGMVLIERAAPPGMLSFFSDVIKNRPTITEEFIHNLTQKVYLNTSLNATQKLDFLVFMLDYLSRSANDGTKGIEQDHVIESQPRP